MLIYFLCSRSHYTSQTTIRLSDHARPSTYPLHGYRYTRPYAMYGTFPNLDLTLDDNLLGSIWQLYYVAAGRKTHNPGCKTHSAEHMTQNKSYALFVQCHYRSTPGCMASVSSKWHHNITSGRDMTNRLFYPSHRCYHVTMFPPHNLSDKTENQCSKSATISIHV